jgi:alpha-beta hydrolase superfamily lysophospholipase
MPAMFFGRSTEPLYGVLEPPRASPRRAGALLLYPGVHEYMRSHWAFRSLAASLSARGFDVLRFDYRGSGDSAGEADATTFEGCVEDACVAANELRDSSGVDSVVLVGMRLGAAVALHAAAKLEFVRRVLLWNPVVRGRDYLAEIEQLDRGLRLRLLLPLRPPAGELAGYPFPAGVRRSIESVDLGRLEMGARRRVEIVVGAEALTPSSPARELAGILERMGHAVGLHGVDDGGGPASYPDAALLARGAIDELVSCATGGDA